MSMGLHRVWLLVVALLPPATMLHAALPTPTDVPGRASLAGQLLVASESMSDPRFAQTVVLMVRHEDGQSKDQ